MQGPGPRPQRVFDGLLLAGLTALLLAVAWHSTRWVMGSDTPIMMYQAMLFNEFGWLPYRDIFDMNMMGSYLSFAAIGRVFGYEDFGLRLADLSLMAVLATLTFQTGRTFAPRVGWLAALCLCTWWLRGSVYLQLQREVLALVPIALGTLAAWSHLPTRRRALFTGLGFGLAATIKPDLAIGAVPMAALIVVEARHEHPRLGWTALAWGTAGVALPGVVMVLGMAAVGILDDFLAALPYLRLYGDFSGEHVIFATTMERTMYRLGRLAQLGGHVPWVAAAAGAIAVLAGKQAAPVRRRMLSVAGLMAVYAVYPFNGGHFWGYHWAPLIWSTSLGLGLLLVVPTQGPRAWQGWVARAVLVVLLVHSTGATRGFRVFRDRRPDRVDKDRSHEIAAYLGKHLEPGDRVQPLDWVTWNVAGGLMRAHAEGATRFIYDFHFYHHVSDPFIQRVRQRFLTEMAQVRPRFVVEGGHKFPYFRGEDAARDFPELEALLASQYTVVVKADGYRIHERKRGGGRAP